MENGPNQVIETLDLSVTKRINKINQKQYKEKTETQY